MNFGNHVCGAVRGDSEEHVAALQFQHVFEINESGQCKEHDRGSDARNAIQSATSAHADGSLGENCRSSGHTDHAAAFAENDSRAEKSDALYDVGGDSRGAGVAGGFGNFRGKNCEESSAYTDAQAGAHACGAFADAAFDADDGAEQSGPEQTVGEGAERQHASFCAGMENAGA